MVVQHNLSAINTNRQMGVVTNALQKSTEKLSSGYKINRAADDAAGLSISEKMRSQIRGLNKASDNAQDGISLIQVAEGALNETHSILQRMNELATQAANDTNTSVDRQSIKDEIKQLNEELDRISSTTQFNKQDLLTGGFSGKLQVGALEGQTMDVKISLAVSAKGLKVSAVEVTFKPFADTAKGLKVSAVEVSTNAKAGAAMQSIQDAIESVSKQRSKLGAIQNRLEHTINNLDTNAENTQAAESRIRDTDMADEMVQYSKNNILSQAGQSMLTQANQQTQGVLSLLQ